MLNELKHITKSHKVRALMLFIVLAVVAVVVVFAIDGPGEYQEYTGYNYEYGVTVADYYGQVGDNYGYGQEGNRYDDVYTPYYDIGSDDGDYLGIAAVSDEYMYYMAGEAGDAPTLMYCTD